MTRVLVTGHSGYIGSVLVPLLLILARSSFLIGWAKPVPVNPRNYRNYRQGDIRVSLAGIAVNLILAVLATLLLIVLIHFARIVPALNPSLSLLAQMARFGILINLVLAFFNLIPIPPLDGSHVLYHLLPPRAGMAYRNLQQYGMLVLMAFIFLARPLFSLLMTPAWLLYDFAMFVVRLWT